MQRSAALGHLVLPAATAGWLWFAWTLVIWLAAVQAAVDGGVTAYAPYVAIVAAGPAVAAAICALSRPLPRWALLTTLCGAAIAIGLTDSTLRIVAAGVGQFAVKTLYFTAKASLYQHRVQGLQQRAWFVTMADIGTAGAIPAAAALVATGTVTNLNVPLALALTMSAAAPVAWLSGPTQWSADTVSSVRLRTTTLWGGMRFVVPGAIAGLTGAVAAELAPGWAAGRSGAALATWVGAAAFVGVFLGPPVYALARRFRMHTQVTAGAALSLVPWLWAGTAIGLTIAVCAATTASSFMYLSAESEAAQFGITTGHGPQALAGVTSGWYLAALIATPAVSFVLDRDSWLTPLIGLGALTGITGIAMVTWGFARTTAGVADRR